MNNKLLNNLKIFCIYKKYEETKDVKKFYNHNLKCCHI